MKKDPRIGHIIQQIVNFSKGNFDRYIKVSDKVDEIDGISAGLNALGEILNNRMTSFPQVEKGHSENIHLMSPPSSSGVFNRIVKNGKNSNTKNSQFDAELFNAIYQNAPHAIVVTNSRQCVVEWNPAAQRIFGWSEEEVKGRFLFEFLVPERFRATHNVGVQKFFKKNTKIESTRSLRFSALCKSSNEIEVNIIVTSVRLSESDFFVGFITECTSSAFDAPKPD